MSRKEIKKIAKGLADNKKDKKRLKNLSNFCLNS
jgi:hypothetical protein